MKFIVNGGRKLEGEISVMGFKNAATPIIAATILTEKPCIIENIPLIGDVLTMIKILESMGSKIVWLDKNVIKIVNDDIDPLKADKHLIRSIRSAILIIGPILARFGRVHIGTPGGCLIGARPLDAHLDSLKELGAIVVYDEKNDIYEIKKPKSGKWGNEVILKEFSVTATENLMMLGMSCGNLKIDLAAAEPHIQDLGNFLKKLGAKIKGLGTHEIIMSGSVENEKEIKHRIIEDPIEAGTFMVLGAINKGKLIIKNAPLSYLTSPLQKLKEFGVDYKILNEKEIMINGESSSLHGAKIQTLPYPGFPTDLQSPFGVLATQSEGESLIFDTLYEGRLKYIEELRKMGANAEILDPHRAVVFGPTKLKGASIESLDLRAGATLVIAALAAEGKSILNNIEQIDRGYEKLEERLQKIGADIQRVI